MHAQAKESQFRPYRCREAVRNAPRLLVATSLFPGETRSRWANLNRSSICNRSKMTIKREIGVRAAQLFPRADFSPSGTIVFRCFRRAVEIKKKKRREKRRGGGGEEEQSERNGKRYGIMLREPIAAVQPELIEFVAGKMTKLISPRISRAYGPHGWIRRGGVARRFRRAIASFEFEWPPRVFNAKNILLTKN